VDQVEDLLDLVGPEALDRRVGAHPARVRPRVPVAHALVIASGGEAHGPRPIADREDGELLALEQLLDEERPAVDDLEGRVELLLAAADEHTLASRQPVRLDDTRRPRDGEGLRRGHSGLDHQLLGEALRALDPGGGGARPEYGEPAAAQAVGDAADERRLRPDHDQIGVELTGQREQAVGVVGAHRMARPQLGNARIARRCMDLLELGAPAQLPGERVLAAA
jgi:hypothetical protein